MLRHKYWMKYEMEAVELPNPRAVNSWRKIIMEVLWDADVYRYCWRPIAPTKARWEVVQGVGDTLTMMVGIMKLLLTNRGLDCLLNSSEGQRITHKGELVLRSSYAGSGKHKQGSRCERRTVEPSNWKASTTITSEYEIVHRSYNSVR